MNKIINLLLPLLLLPALTGQAQLSDMSVDFVRCTGNDPAGPVNKLNKKPFALLKLELEDGKAAVINGIAVEVSPSMTIKAPYADDKLYDGYAKAWNGTQSKEVMLHHPAFNNLTVSFAEYLGDEPMMGGNIYTIRLKIPTSQLLGATMAYNKLDFADARERFRALAANSGANPEERLIAENYLADLDTLVSYVAKARAYESSAASKSGKQRDFDLYRAAICWKSIHSISHVVAAALKVDQINHALGIGPAERVADALNAFRLVGDSLVANDLRAFGNEAVPFEYPINGSGKTSIGKCALLRVKVPAEGATVTAATAIRPVEFKEGEYWVYVPSYCDDRYKAHEYWDSDPLLFSIEHPDYRRLDFRVSDLEDGQPPLAENVYAVEFDSPTLVMSLANKMLAQLELESAYNLYRHNYADATEQEFASRMCAMLGSDAVRPLLTTLEQETKDCNNTDVEWNRILRGIRRFDNIEERNAALRKVNAELSAKAASLATKYSQLYKAADMHGVNLTHASLKAADFEKMSKGVRRVPMLISFTEVRKVSNGVYRPEQQLEGSPTVKFEFRNARGDVVDTVTADVKDGTVSIRPNIDASLLFIKGEGKMKISIPSKLNNSAGSKKAKYNDNEVDIAKLRIDDYQIVRYNACMTGK